MSPYTLFRGKTVILGPRYYGSIDYYATLAIYENAFIDYGARRDKRQKLTHRTTIADVNGPLQLTMPVSTPPSGYTDGKPLRWRDMLLSSHNQWWNIHRIALESAYGRTPFFEFYIDRFLPALSAGVVDRFPTLEAINRYIDNQIRQILLLPPDTLTTPFDNSVDLTRREPQLPDPWPQYHQLRAHRLGFIPHLSILDLIFNLGPEACLWLRDITRRNFEDTMSLFKPV